MITFERIEMKDVDWNVANSFGEINIFQTQAWFDFLLNTQKLEPVVVIVKEDGHVQGYFFGLITNKFGLRILGSPFRGWMTYFMGFNLSPKIARIDVLKYFPSYVFKQLKCHYVELVDPRNNTDEATGLSFRVEHLPWFALDLTSSEDDLFANMKDTGRRGIRKAIKSGVTVEEASDIGFADEYYAQYQEVMSDKSLTPTYELEFVRKLIEQIYPINSLLLLRARDPNGLCIATGLFLILGNIAVFWGGASWKQYQSMHPNELIIWNAMKILKARGAHVLQLGGEAEQFKLKFGSTDAQIFRLMKAKNPLLDRILEIATSPTSIRYRNWFLRRI